MADLTTRVLGLDFANPIVLASGPAGSGIELLEDISAADVGAITLKTATPDPRPGNPQPRLVDCPSGALNSIGLENPGCEAFVRDVLPWVADLPCRRIGSLSSADPARMREMVRMMGQRSEIDAIEVNLSCPNAEGAAIATDTTAVRRVVRAAVEGTDVPILAKLPGDTDAFLDAGAASLDAGAQGLTLINALRGLRIDRNAGRPFLHREIGGLCGPAIFPIALARVFEARRAFPDTVLIGTGGVVDVGGAVEMLLAGANLVGIGFGFMVDPCLPARIGVELGNWMAEREIESISEIVGAAHRGGLDVR